MRNPRLIAKGLGKDHLLFTLHILDLPLASLQSVVDTRLLLSGILLAGSLLVLQFFLKLGDELDVTCKNDPKAISQGPASTRGAILD